MKKHIIAFASITYANKAKALLNKYRINAVLGRTPRSIAGGCGYSLVVQAPSEKIISILEENRIPYKTISEIS